ncbi:GntR family transcriptional regulator [Orrella sp. JC864]|uniref:GntR family transcriptional regulator n=1 Tax=Orrella sp. JC864 TaxID=3120298 RepID=UPI0012BC8280
MTDTLLHAATPGPAASGKISRPMLHQTVTDRLRTMIVEAVLPPGARLNERELCESLGISRTPLREAIKVLAAESLVEILPNRGAMVARMTEEDIRQTFELMSGLEAFGGELACERITARELAEIEALHEEMLACRARRDLPAYYSRNHAIHDRISQAARNPALRQIYVSINLRLQALRFRSNFQEAKWDHAIQDHIQMIEALRARDGKRLSAILRQHLLDKRDAVLGTMGDERGA